MSELKLTGTVHEIMEMETFQSGFQKQTLVVNSGGTYPQYLPIEFMKDKIDLLNGLKVGDELTVHINLNGRLWTDPQGKNKYFPSINGWKIEKATATTQQPTPVSQNNPFASDEDSSDLPF